MKSAKAEGLTLGLRSAIYARKSNDDTKDKHADDKSVARQISQGREFIKRMGWLPPEEQHVYVDDGVSGAEFVKRDGLKRLQSSLRTAGVPPFDVLVTMEVSRVGRSGHQMVAAFVGIAERGIRIFTYLNGEEIKLETAKDELMLSLAGFSAADEREKAVERCRDAALHLAQAGRNFGGRVYGYNNVWKMPDGTEQPGVGEDLKPPAAQTLYRINTAQADVVRGVYQMYADGYGCSNIALTLNGNTAQAALLRQYFGGTAPYPPRKHTLGWYATTIRDMLKNPRYLGFIPFGATRRKYIGGTVRTISTLKSEQLFPAPDLRIIDDQLANAVKRRVDGMRMSYFKSRTGTQADSGRASRFLLSGLMRCEKCGAAMIVSSSLDRKAGEGVRARQYVCSGRSNRGSTYCTNSLRPRIASVDGELLKAMERFMTPTVIQAAAQRAAELIRTRSSTKPSTVQRLRTELAKAERDRANGVAAILAGNSKPAALVAALAALEGRIEALKRELAQFESAPALDQLGSKRLVRELATRATQWRGLLDGDPARARQALRALLAGPIMFAPVTGGYRLAGNTRLGALFSGPERRLMGVSPAATWRAAEAACRTGCHERSV